jgi:hypothetical protein
MGAHDRVCEHDQGVNSRRKLIRTIEKTKNKGQPDFLWGRAEKIEEGYRFIKSRPLKYANASKRKKWSDRMNHTPGRTHARGGKWRTTSAS